MEGKGNRNGENGSCTEKVFRNPEKNMEGKRRGRRLSRMGVKVERRRGGKAGVGKREGDNR
jgi:hypothetical protein